MDIGPVSAIRPVSMIRPSPTAPDLSRVVEAHNRGHSADDEYTAADGKAGRGLEDEEEETAADAPDQTPLGATPSGNVSFFA